MNHIYKVIWSKITQSLVVVSELATNQGKAHSSTSRNTVTQSSLAKSSFKLSAVSALLMAAMPTANAAVVIAGNSGNYWNVASASGASVPYNYGTPNNTNYPGQSNSNIYSGNLRAAQSISIGANTNATSGSIAFGDYSSATGGLSLALGPYSRTTQAGAIALGTSTLASGFDSFAAMRQAAATADFAMAMGTAANANGNSSIAMGSSALALGTQSIAIGSATMNKSSGSGGEDSYTTTHNNVTNTKAQGDRAIALGVNTSTTSNDSIAIGTNTKTNSGTGAIAIGWCSSTSYQDSVAMGSNATANGTYTVALGYNATSTNSSSISIGWNSAATNTQGGPSQGSVAIGPSTVAKGNQSVALGAVAQAAEQATAIGNDARASGFGSIVIGGDDTGYSSNKSSDPYTYASTGNVIGYLPYDSANSTYSNYRTSVSSGVGTVTVGVHGQALSQGSTAIGVYATAGDNGEYIVDNTTTTNAIEATAIGAMARAKSTRSTAIGYSADALDEEATAIGSNTTANSTDSMALGSNSTANGNSSLAAGYNATTNGLNALAIGSSAQALAENAISIGTGNIVTGKNSGAIGDPTTISGEGSYSLGNNNTIPDDNSTVVGNDNVLSQGDSGASTSDGSHVVGNNAKVRGTNSIAMGNNVVVGDALYETGEVSTNATAIGTYSKANGVNALALGTGATAYHTNNTVIGTNATVGRSAGTDNIAFGSNTNVTSGNNSVVIGKDSKSEAINGSSIALGNNASISSGVQQNGYAIGTNANIASTNGGIAFGTNATITNSNGGEGASVAIGENATATGTSSISIGYNANSSGSQRDSIAIGTNATASGLDNIAIGKGASASGSQGSHVVIGTKANATGAESIVVGANANATGSQAEQIVIGSNATATSTSQYGIVMGSNATASREYSTVLGANTDSTVDGGVALGANSQSTRGYSGSATAHPSTITPYIPDTADTAQSDAINATKATTGAVSVGSDTVKRQIINVAAGSEDSDAVNVAQLKAAVSSTSWNLQNNGVQKDEIKSGDTVNFVNGTGTVAQVTGNSTNSTVKYSVDMTGLNVASDGTVSAVKNGDKFATAEQVAKAINDSEKNTTVNSTNGTIAATATTSGTVTNYDLDLSQAAKDSLAKADSALQSWTAQVNGTDAKVVNQTSNTVNFVNGTNTVVSADANGNISVSTAENVTFNTVNASTFNAGDVSISNNGINAGGKTVTNVANGTQDSDAVNFSQLNATNTNVANNAQNITNNANAIANNTQNITNNTNAINKGINFGNGTSANNFALGSTINVTSDSNLVVSTVTDGVKLTLADSIAVGNVTVNDTFKAGDVTINNSGIDAGNHTITNVTAGTNATDAVNVAQLNASQSSVKAGDNVNVTSAKDANGTVYTVNANTSTVSNGSDKVMVTKTDTGNHTSNYAVDLSQSAKDSLTKADSALQSWTAQVNGADAKVVNQTSNTVNFVNGTNTVVSADASGNISVSTAENVTFNTVNASTFNAGNVSISGNGINAGGKTVTNVANGTQDSDAVNLSQLNATNTNVANNAQNITNNANNITNNTNAIANNTQNITNNTNAINKGINFGNGTSSNNFALGSTINVTSDSNLVVSTVTDGVKLTLADSIAVDNVTVNNTFKAGNVTINNSGIDAGNTTISNVANGTADSDAVNLGQLEKYIGDNAYNWNLSDGTNSNAVADDSTVAIKGSANADSAKTAGIVTALDGTNVSVDLSEQTKSDIQQGVDANTTVNNKGITFAADSGAATERKLGETLTVNGDNDLINTTASAGKIEVAATDKLKDAVTNATSALQSVVTQIDGKDVKTLSKADNKANFVSGDNISLTDDGQGGIKIATKENVTFNTVNATTFNAGDVSISNNGINAGGKTVTNVANGTQDSDAVNFSQLNATNTNVANNAQNITNNANNISNNTKAIANNTQNITTNANNIAANTAAIKQGFNIGADKGSDDNVQLGETVNYNGDSNIITTVSDNAIAFALNSSIAVDNVTVNNTFKAGDVTINTAGIDAGNHAITNVTAGTNATDAVNLAQLNASQSSVKAGDNVNVTSAKDANGTVYTVNANTSTVSNGSDKVTVTKTDAGNHTSNYAVDLSEQTKSDIQQGVDANTTVNSKGITFAADSGTATERKLGETLTVNGDSDLINTTASAGKIAVAATDKLKNAVTNATSALQSVVTQIDGTDVKTLNKADNKANFVSGDNISLTDDGNGGIKIATKDDVTFTTVNASTFNAGDVSISSNGINAGGKTVSNVANGTQDSDAVNFSQLNATNTNVANNAQNITNNANNISNNTNAIANNTQNITTNANNIAANTAAIKQGFNIGADKGNDDNVQLGETVNYNGDSNIITTVSDNAIAFALNSSIAVDNVTVNNTFKAGDVTINNSGIDAGNHAITNVTAGTNATDAVNLGQLEKYIGDNSYNWNLSDGTNNSAVADNSTVAIKGSANADSAKTAGIVTALDGTNVSVDLSDKTKSDIQQGVNANTTVSKGFNIGADKGNDDNVQLGETVNYNGDSNIITTVSDNAIAFALNPSLNLTDAGSVTMGDVVVNNGGITIANGTTNNQAVSLTKDGLNNGGNKISNVANGTQDSDAVNLAQLNASQSSVKAGDNVNVISAKDANGTVYTVNANTSTVSNGSDKVTVTKTDTGNHTSNYAVDLSDAAKSSLTKADSALQSLTTSADGNQAQTLNQENSNANFISGNNIQLTPSANGITVATKADVTFTNVTATNVNGNTVTIGSGANTTTLSSTAEGLDVGGDKLTNISAGTNKTDAVNLGQLEKYIGDNSYNWNLSDGTNNSAVADNSTVAIKGSANADSAKTAGIVTALDGTNVSVDLSEQTKSDIQQGVNANTTVSKGFNIGADNGNDDNVQLGETVNYNGDSNIITTVSDNAIAFALNSSLNLTDAGSVTMGDVVVNNGGITIANGSTNNQAVSLTKDGLNNGGNKITNVANGTQDSDAVNVAQLNASQSSVKAGDNVNVTSAKDANGTVYTVNANTSTVSNGSDKVTVTKTDAGNHTSNYAVDLSDAAKSSLTKADSALQSLTTSADGTTAQTLNQENSNANFISGNNIQLTPSANGITVATKADVTFTNVTATNVNGNTVTIGSGANTTTLSSTAEGLDVGGDKLTNISAGTNKTDAVNLGQLEKYIGDNSYNWNLSDGTNNSAVADNSTVAIKGSANADSAKTAGIVTALDGTNVSVDLSDKTKSDIQQGVNANTTVSKGFNIGADKGNDDNVQLGEKVNYNGDGNIITTVSNNKIAFALNHTLNLTGAGSVTMGDVVVNNGGITIANGTTNNQTVSLTKDGLNNGGNKITNVANGTAPTDAVNLSQLNEVKTTANAGWNLTANGQNSSNVAPNATVDLANKDGNINITKSGNNVTFGLSDKLNIGTGANTVVIDGTTGKVSTGNVSISKDGINAGNQTITNVAAGEVSANSTDAVNGSQLYAMNANITNGLTWKITGNSNVTNATTVGNQTVSFNNGTNTVAVVNGTNVTFNLADNITLTNNGSMTIGSTVITSGNIKVGDNVAVTETGFTAGNVSVTTSGINAGGNKITNVADGEALTDAVNLGQLQAAMNVTTANASWNLTVNGADSSSVKPKDTVNLANKDGNINITKSGNNVTFDLSDKLNIGSGANTVVIDGTTGKVSAGNVSIGKDGISAGNQTITNVASGVNGTDAVNVDQLRDYTSSVVDKPLTFAGDTGTPSERKMGSTVTVKGGVSDTAKLTDNNIGVVSDGQGSLNVKLAKDLTGLNSVTISNGSASTKLTTVTKKNVEGKEASALDVGGNQITNVAPGEVSKNSTDAVNGSQLHATNQQVIRNANAINQVAGQVHSVDRKLRAGVAGALASGGLYHATMPGKSMVAAGAGTYRGESAIAVGYSRLSDNGKLGVKFSVNSNTRGDTGAAASVGYQW